MLGFLFGIFWVLNLGLSFWSFRFYFFNLRFLVLGFCFLGLSLIFLGLFVVRLSNLGFKV